VTSGRREKKSLPVLRELIIFAIPPAFGVRRGSRQVARDLLQRRSWSPGEARCSSGGFAEYLRNVVGAGGL
jgi:hypothetical protein